MYSKKEILIALSSYFLWGVLPIYWKQIAHVAPMEILAHRILWSMCFLIIIIWLSKRMRAFLVDVWLTFRKSEKWFSLIWSAFFLNVNWLTYIWAVNNDHILQTSMGYYINPLLSVFLGLIVLREKLTTSLWIAFLIVLIGVGLLIYRTGVFPWVSIILAGSFAMYGLMKKMNPLSSVHSLTLETMISSIPALIYIVFLSLSGGSAFFQPLSISLPTQLFLIGGGVVTAIPLILFSIGAKKLPLYLIGFFQYLAPTITLIVGVYIYNEVFTVNHLLSFGLIWTGLIVFTLSMVLGYRRYTSV